MAGGVCDDELTPIGGKESIGDVDGNSLLALGREAVDQQGEINILALGTDPLGVNFQDSKLVLVNHLRIVKQSSDEGRFAVIYTSAREESQQSFV